LKKNTVILIDEDRAAMAQFAQLIGPTYLVRTTSLTDQALNWLENDLSVSCIIAEQTLKKARGLELLKQARAARPEVRRVLATRYSDLTEIVQGVHGGIINRIIAKPYAAAEIQYALALEPIVSPASAGAAFQAGLAT
jgi:DNA-binding NtrC family response regulator